MGPLSSGSCRGLDRVSIGSRSGLNSNCVGETRSGLFVGGLDSKCAQQPEGLDSNCAEAAREVVIQTHVCLDRMFLKLL